ncbi:MAG: hypothetical protein V4726_02560 [Verrucomicrobiota bacterium]
MSKFTLGQTVCISRRSYRWTSFTPWRQGTVTAVGESTVRVRTVTLLPWGKVRWIHLNNPLWQVSIVED